MQRLMNASFPQQSTLAEEALKAKATRRSAISAHKPAFGGCQQRGSSQHERAAGTQHDNLLLVEGDALRGFTLHHDHVPLIFVNSAVKHPAARSFTLLHELAHLLRGVDKACDKHDLQSRTSEEAWCNRFAAAFLMPQSELASYMATYLKKGFIQDGDIDSVRRIAGYFYCSYYSVAIRLKQLGLASAGLVDAVSGSFEEPAQDGFARGGQTRVQKRLSAYGTGIARLFGEALQNAAVSEIEVRKSLNLKSQNELRSFLALGREAV
jgi:Zn-dependent peptidase ImmA (M78 family)